MVSLGLIFAFVVQIIVVAQLEGRLAMAGLVIVLGAIVGVGVPLALTLMAGHLIERWQRRERRKVGSQWRTELMTPIRSAVTRE